MSAPLPDASPARFTDAGSGADRRRVAFRVRSGRGPAVVWLGGFRSDMRGAKAERLDAFCAARGQAFCRLDYSGHGESGGDFALGTISRWREDAEAAIRAADLGTEPLVLVGSSMGAWIALLVARAKSLPLAGMLLLAPAPDFTHRLLLPRLSSAQREEFAASGRLEEASPYSAAPTLYTRALVEDGAVNLVMDAPVETGCPVHIIQGLADPDVPHAHALALVERMPADAVTLTLVPDGDHRLSREADLSRMEAAVAALTRIS